jgi:cyclic pyranopterin phosphate synthase
MRQVSCVEALDPAPMLADGLPVHVHHDRTLRVKITDACGMTCTFCHNEGTPVVADNLGRAAGELTGRGRSGRVSIYLASNGAHFLPATIAPDDDFVSALTRLRDALDLDKLHLTGGEPSLHPRLAEIVSAGRSADFRVCMTSNGENGARVIAGCARAGLDRVNFSIFGTTAAELARVQHERFADVTRAEGKIRALHDSVGMALAHGVAVSANIVVPGFGHASRVRRLMEQHAPELSVRLLNSLDDGIESIEAIERILDDLGAIPTAHHVTAGASGWRTSYRLPDARVVWFKQIRPVRLPQTCAGCRFNNGIDCHEGYYGVRLYRDRKGGFQVGVCIQRMDLCLPLEEFVGSDLSREIIALRDAEYLQLSLASPVDSEGSCDADRV